MIKYVPGEANSDLFGGNSSWRGPIWMPTNYTLIKALEKFHRFLGDGFAVPVPCLNNRELTLKEIATLLAERLVAIYHRDLEVKLPVFPATALSMAIPTGRICCYFTSTFMAIPVEAWGQLAKLAGLGC